jgi:hypothetical protein
MEASSTNSKPVFFTPFLLWSLCAWLPCFIANPLANIDRSVLTVWLVPIVICLPLGVWAGLCSYKRSLAKASSFPLPRLDAALIGMASLCLTGVVGYWDARNLFQGIGALASGTHLSVAAVLTDVETPTRGRKAYCKQYATFQVPGPRAVRLCVVSSWRTLSENALEYGVPVTFQVVSNFAGTRVISIVRS